MMKILFRNVHLYLALAAGLIIMVSCITGSILVFEDEIDSLVNHQRYFAEATGNRLPADLLVKTALMQRPEAKLATVKVFSASSRTVEVGLFLPAKKDGRKDPDKGKTKMTGKGAKPPKATIFVYVNPYTGQIADIFEKRASFFYTVERLHRWLLGGSDSIGQIIIGLSTLSFLIITLTGIVLWWPKNKKILLQRLKFKTDASFKRLNHDLHVVTGFYTSLFLLIIICTGLVMAFGWANKSIYLLTGTKMDSPEPPHSVYRPESSAKKINDIYTIATHIDPHAAFYTIRMPKDTTGIVTLNILDEGAGENKADTYYLDQYTGSVRGKLLYTDKNLGQRIRSYVKYVHTGAVLGIPGKIFAFVLCLLTFSFPITGVILWLNRIKKKKSKPEKRLNGLVS